MSDRGAADRHLGLQLSGFWLVLRVWLGWEWPRAGWTKVFGGTLTWRIWDWGDNAYALTGGGNVGWIPSGTVTVGEVLSGLALIAGLFT